MINRTIYLIAAFLLSFHLVHADILTDGDQTKFISEFLSAHNAYRKSVSEYIPDLKWDENLAALAANTANTCVY